MAWKVFEQAKSLSNIKKRDFVTEGPIFRLHYRASFYIHLFCAILVTTQQYIGEHIRCITNSDTAVNNKVVNTFCYFQNTFTVVYNETEITGAAPFPRYGIRNNRDGDEVVVHAYYQWVPYVLFLQAMAFYAPYYLWKKMEKGYIKGIVKNIIKWKRESDAGAAKKILKAAKLFHSRRGCHYVIWTMMMTISEILNLVNVALQFYLTNCFLGGNFYTLGSDYWKDTKFGKFSLLDVVFPKLTKCTFHKYGSSGGIQNHDAMCVMAVNIINEKIYVFLWYWYIILMFLTASVILLLLFLMLMYSNKNVTIFKAILHNVSKGRVTESQMTKDIMKRYKFPDWMVLYWVGENIDGFMYKRFLTEVLKLPDQETAGDGKVNKPNPDSTTIINEKDDEKAPLLPPRNEEDNSSESKQPLYSDVTKPDKHLEGNQKYPKLNVKIIPEDLGSRDTIGWSSNLSKDLVPPLQSSTVPEVPVKIPYPLIPPKEQQGNVAEPNQQITSLPHIEEQNKGETEPKLSASSDSPVQEPKEDSSSSIHPLAQNSPETSFSTPSTLTSEQENPESNSNAATV